MTWHWNCCPVSFNDLIWKDCKRLANGAPEQQSASTGQRSSTTISRSGSGGAVRWWQLKSVIYKFTNRAAAILIHLPDARTWEIRLINTCHPHTRSDLDYRWTIEAYYDDSSEKIKIDLRGPGSHKAKAGELSFNYGRNSCSYGGIFNRKRKLTNQPELARVQTYKLYF